MRKILFSRDDLMRAVAGLGLAAVLVTAVAASRSQVAAALRAGHPVAGLLMGTDLVDYARHSDTLMLWHYNPVKGRVDLLSIPRDTHIDLPGYRFNRINEVFAYHYGLTKDPHAAAEEVLKAVAYISGSGAGVLWEPRHYLQVDYNGFRKMVDLVGGVMVHVDEPMHYDDNAGGYHIHRETGDYHMNGDEALSYVRFRGKSGDRGRILRQMEFLKLLAGRATSPFLFLRGPRLFSTLYGSMHTNLRPWDFLFLALEVKHMGPDGVNPWLLPGRPRGAYWQVDTGRTALVVSQVLEDRPATAGPTAPAPEERKAIRVKSGTAQSGAGWRWKWPGDCGPKGFDVLEWGNYNGRQVRTRVMDRIGVIEKARNVAHTLGVTSVFSDVDPSLRTDVEVIVGDDYR